MQFTKKSRIAFLNFLLSKYSRLKGDNHTAALPYHILIDPSSCCNLRCSMCMDENDPNRRIRPSRLMSPDLYQSLLDELGDYLFMVSLYNWGEPLLNPYLSDFIRQAKQYDIFVDLNTNLALELTDDALTELLQSGVDNIVVSIDGFSQNTYGQYRLGGSFDLARRNITRLSMLREQLALPNTITWKYLVFSFNEHEIEQAERYCSNFGITFSRKDAIIDLEKHPEWLPSYRKKDLDRLHGGWPFTRGIAPELKTAGREASCAWHYCYSVVNADGSVSPCCAVIDAKDDFGTIVPGTRTFSDIWNGELFRTSRELMTRADGLEPDTWNTVCGHCPFPFLKDLSTGMDQSIIARFQELYGMSDPVQAAAFDRLAAGRGFKEYMDANLKILDARSPALGQVGYQTGKDKESPTLSGNDSALSGRVSCDHGICSVCGAESEFFLKKADFSLRETVCSSCGASRRTRDVASAILKIHNLDSAGSLTAQIPGLAHLHIFEAQADGPLHAVLRDLPTYCCAEFLDGVQPGCANEDGVRCEDLERLTYVDGCFDLVITQDVFEHVADPYAAFREISRVLKPGGRHIFTVPLHEGRNSVTRVESSPGKPLAHRLPPVYHGDPLRASGSLVYTDFGDDLPSLLLPLGFTTEVVCRQSFYTPEELPWIDNEESHARYVQCRQRGEILAYLRYNSVVFCSTKISGETVAPECHLHKEDSNNMGQDDRLTEEHGKLPPPPTAMQREPGMVHVSTSEPMTDEFSELLDLLLEEQIPAVFANKIGELCVSHGFPSTGKAFFHKALQTGVTTDEALNNLGVLSFHNGDYLQAEQYLYQSISVNPANWPARQNLADLYDSVPQLAERTADEFVFCPCCDGVFPAFIAGGPNLRPNAYCPRCGSLERHRLLWLFLQKKTNFFTANLKVLHVAPEKIFQEAFKMLPHLDYVSADLVSPLAMIKMDVTDIQFADNTFDVIICSHVLEHVPDDRKAMGELLRVLKPSGWAILQVPIDMNRSETFEDPDITDPAERQRLFGQDDHVRWYGRDYPERLKGSGFEVTVQSFAREMSPESVQRTGIVLDEDIFFCRKPLSNAKEAPRRQDKMPGQIHAPV